HASATRPAPGTRDTWTRVVSTRSCGARRWLRWGSARSGRWTRPAPSTYPGWQPSCSRCSATGRLPAARPGVARSAPAHEPIAVDDHARDLACRQHLAGGGVARADGEAVQPAVLVGAGRADLHLGGDRAGSEVLHLHPRADAGRAVGKHGLEARAGGGLEPR